MDTRFYHDGLGQDKAVIPPQTNTWVSYGPKPFDSVGTTNNAYRYGTPRGPVEEALRAGRDVLYGAADSYSVRLGQTLYGHEKLYPQVLFLYWVWAPYRIWLMLAVMTIAWVHGCIGLYLWLRMKAFYKRAAPFLLVSFLFQMIGLSGSMVGSGDMGPAAMMGGLGAIGLRESAHHLVEGAEGLSLEADAFRGRG